MQSISAEELLAVWEAGREQHELDRVLTLLLAASPKETREELAGLTIGERDTRLLRLRTLLFGSRATGFAECPECGERVEIPIDIAVLVAESAPSSSEAAALHEVEANGTRFQFRLPTSRDLAEVVPAASAADGLRRLLQSCLLSPVSPNELPNDTIEVLSQAMLEADPQAEMTLAFSCPGCARRWEMLFDIAHFFWNEIAAHARRLLRAIDVLARAYGWSEREILTLSAQRRESYLELVTS
jgi:hypothetical protein